MTARPAAAGARNGKQDNEAAPHERFLAAWESLIADTRGGDNEERRELLHMAPGRPGEGPAARVMPLHFARRALPLPPAMHNDIATVLHHETTILSRLDTMARDIMRDYEGKDLTVVAILQGGLILMADLLRRVQLPLRIETISVSSYRGTESTGTVTFLQNRMPDISGRHVLLLDDILDSGRTLHAIRRRLLEECAPASVRICVLLRKHKQRACVVNADYVGFDIEDEFVVGYGLDYMGRYRNLPYIGVLRPEAISAGAAA